MATRMKKARGDGKGSERISRDMLQTKTLSLKARGLLSLLKSLPDDWDCGGVTGISKTFCAKDGPHAVNEAIKELEEHGLFMRLKHQGDGGKWDWLWTFADYPDEVAAEVRRWEAKGFRTANRSGNKNAQPPPRDSTGSLFENLEQGAMTGEPAGGDPANGEPPNKESSPPLEEESSRGQGLNTHASRAASPPCDTDPLFQEESFTEPVEHTEGDDIQVKVDDKTNPLKEDQIELVSSPAGGLPGHVPGQGQADPFADQHGDPDLVVIDLHAGRRPSSADRSRGKGRGSPAAFGLIRAYSDEVSLLPLESRNQLLPLVSEFLRDGFEREDIFAGITESLVNKLGWQRHLANKVAAARAQRLGASTTSSTTGQRISETERMRAQMKAMDAAESAGQLDSYGMRAIGGGE
jgi:hypothetical protein